MSPLLFCPQMQPPCSSSVGSAPPAYTKFVKEKGFNYRLVMLGGVTSDVCILCCVYAAISPSRARLRLQRSLLLLPAKKECQQ